MSELKVDAIKDAAGTGQPDFPNGYTSPLSELLLKTGNGHGSTNTQIRRYSAIEINSPGTGMTLTQSATDGDSVTIDETGLYAIDYVDSNGSGGGEIGVTVNSAELTTAPGSLSTDSALVCISVVPNAGNTIMASAVRRFTATDVVRVHGNTGGTPSTSANKSRFHIIQLTKES